MSARGFPAFPAGRRGSRGGSRWAQAWVRAMEETSLDSDQLRKGRRYATSGQVGPITVAPGRVSASVHGLYDAVLAVEPLPDDDWDRFLDQVLARSGHLAALLDRELPGELGTELLPGVGEFDSSCTCDAWELPCLHAAALGYQMAWLLDEDPFLLCLLRGRSEEELLGELRRRRVRVGTPAVEAYAESPKPLPDPAPIPDPYDGSLLKAIPDPPAMDATVIRHLATEAAARARTLLTGCRTPGPTRG
jgi:uncharacterized Zn finger protein